MSPTNKTKTSPHSSNETLPSAHIDQKLTALTPNNITDTNGHHAVIKPEHKLHRRNPLVIRQEVQSLDDLPADTTLADVQLREMPGLQNTEQWKRIAARGGQVSPPLSRQYYENAAPSLELQNPQMAQVLGSYRRPGRADNDPAPSVTGPSKLQTRRRNILFVLSMLGLAAMIIIAIVVIVVVVQKPKETTTDYYSGHVIVQARFDPMLRSPSSTLAINYQREFCTLVRTTLEVRKTKYAVFYSTCVVYNFRNGSIIGDFTLGFTRYQNVTRLNAFLDRTIINMQLFGGTIYAIVFNTTLDNKGNDSDYDTDYDGSNSVGPTVGKQADIPTYSVVQKRTSEQQTPDEGLEKELLPSIADAIAPTIPPAPTSVVDVDKTEDENERITLLIVDDRTTSFQRHILPVIKTPTSTKNIRPVCVTDEDLIRPGLMASNDEQSASPQQSLSDHLQRSTSTRLSDIDSTFVSNTNRSMSDENHDPSSSPLPTKMRPKPVDARSAAASSFKSSLDSPKSATITNISQRLPSTSVEVSVGELLSTDDKRASVSIREQQQQQQQQPQASHRHSTSSCSSSELDDLNESSSSQATKMDLGEATRELTRLLHIGNENTISEIHLNPDAPDFTPIDFSPTYRSELAPAHLHRRATQVDYYNNRHSRSRYFSESYHHSVASNPSTIRPLLSLVPQYVPYHRQSWGTTTPPSASSSAWWQQEYSNPSSATSSYHSKPAYPLYSPLMPPLTDDSLYPNRNSSKRQRVHSSRAFVFPNQSTTTRKRSHSGPETPLQPPPTHLNGIHSLTKIMIDILRAIDPLPIKEEQKSKTESVSSISSSSYSQRQNRRPSNNTHQRRFQQRNDSFEVEDVFVDDEIATITALIKNASDTAAEEQPVWTSATADTDVKTTAKSTSSRSEVDDSLSEANSKEDSSTPSVVSGTPTADASN